MDKIEIRNWKSISILLGICFIFLILVINAYQYIPSSTDNKSSINTEEFVSDELDDEFEDENSENVDSGFDEKFVYRQDQADKTNVKNNTSKEFKYKNTLFKEEPIKSSKEKRIESIVDKRVSEENRSSRRTRQRVVREQSSTNLLENVDNRENFHKLFNQAESFKRNYDYENALQAFLKLYKMNPDSHQKLELLDNIALLYALTKDYESAIPYAKEACKISPTQKREIMLTKLYYKNGQIEIATKRINKVLQSNFELDN